MYTNVIIVLLYLHIQLQMFDVKKKIDMIDLYVIKTLNLPPRAFARVRYLVYMLCGTYYHLTCNANQHTNAKHDLAPQTPRNWAQSLSTKKLYTM
jgi:hypothetical protein